MTSMTSCFKLIESALQLVSNYQYILCYCNGEMQIPGPVIMESPSITCGATSHNQAAVTL